MAEKPLGYRNFGSIPHLPNSRMGPGDHACSPGQERIATVRVRDKHDFVTVTEKLDGSNTGIAKIGREIVPLTRAGYRATDSPYEQHHLFHDWVMANENRFDAILEDGNRVCGEWLAQAHGTRYDLTGREPWVMFDLFLDAHQREATWEARYLADKYGFAVPHLLATEPVSVEEAMSRLGKFGFYGARDPVEGVVYRVERDGKCDYLCKWVRGDKVDGSYLESQTGEGPVWNWRPDAG